MLCVEAPLFGILISHLGQGDLSESLLPLWNALSVVKTTFSQILIRTSNVFDIFSPPLHPPIPLPETKKAAVEECMIFYLNIHACLFWNLFRLRFFLFNFSFGFCQSDCWCFCSICTLRETIHHVCVNFSCQFCAEILHLEMLDCKLVYIWESQLPIQSVFRNVKESNFCYFNLVGRNLYKPLFFPADSW